MSLFSKLKSNLGWRFSLFAGAASCTAVFIVNLVATILAVTRSNKNQLGQPVFQEGKCSDMRFLNAGLHLVINALSSILLAASNYGMQCISAPTRADVDKAHLRGKWLDIGVPSMHNLRRLPTNRVILWGLLMLSSLPLHLLYNSVLFSSLVTVPYRVWSIETAHHNLSQSELFSRPQNLSKLYYDFYPEVHTELLEEWRNLTDLGTSNGLKRLSNLECIRQYATAFQTSHQDVILVTGTKELKSKDLVMEHWSASVDVYFPEESYSWVCPSTYAYPCRDRLPALEKAAENWAPYFDKVEYCYSRPAEEACQLTFSPTFIAYVLVSNALKAAILLYIALKPPAESLLVLGDAVESFLTAPDAVSAGGCLAAVSDIKKKDNNEWTRPRTWAPVKRRWASAISRRRWTVSILVYSVSLSVVLFFLIFGIIRLRGSRDLGSLWRLGFGAVTGEALISTKGNSIVNSFTMTQAVLLANLPQFIFSGLYFQYNGLLTGMLAANEWSDFGRKKKGLRVSSDPRGEQRSRYFLQLPYRWSIPLILMSMLIHWMISQSIFIVAIDLVDEFATTCGYSPAAIVAVVITAVVMALAVVITGYRRLPTAMPVVGSCSLGIAAACHGLGDADRSDEALVPLIWGAMTHPDEVSGNTGHCGFSSNDVDQPYEGGLYS
ncbi:hypothetical protein LRP88_02274 [Fusarium phalaenopsidis]